MWYVYIRGKLVLGILPLMILSTCRFAMVTPLSLQQSCFLKIISDLETFPPESLALLPLTLRHKLACNLPAVDVCQLEQTTYWTWMRCGLTSQRWQTRMLEIRMDYFSSVCTILLNHHSNREYRTVIRKLLFSVKDCLSINC